MLGMASRIFITWTDLPCSPRVLILVSVPDPKPTPARIAFSFPRVILEAIYVPDEVWGRDYANLKSNLGDISLSRFRSYAHCQGITKAILLSSPVWAVAYSLVCAARCSKTWSIWLVGNHMDSRTLKSMWLHLNYCDFLYLMHSTSTRKPRKSTNHHQTLPSPCVILKPISTGVGWVWLVRLA